MPSTKHTSVPTVAPRPAATASTPVAAALAAAASAVLVVAGPLILSRQGYLWVLLVLVAAAAVYGAVIDVRTLQLPNALTGPLATAGAVQVLGYSVFYGGVGPAGSALAAAAVVFVVYALMATAGWCGFGDAKFAGALALFVGMYVGLLAIYLIPLSVTLGSAHMLVTKALSRRPVSRIPQGPAIAAAALIIMTLGLVLFD